MGYYLVKSPSRKTKYPRQVFLLPHPGGNSATELGLGCVISYKRAHATLHASPFRTLRVVFCDLSIHEDDPGFERVYGEPGNLRNFAAFDVSISRSFYDDYRYVNFTSALVNPDGRFDLRDGIYAAPYSGTYLFAVHGLPMRKRPFRLQGGNNINIRSTRL